MPSQAEIQKQIRDWIVEGLKKGVVTWKRPWRSDKNSGSPANVISRRAHSGINPPLLDLVAMERDFSPTRDLVSLAQILGHENLQTTSRYSQRSGEQLGDTAERVVY